MSKQIVNIGDTGTALISKLANNFDMVIDPYIFNVKDYGAGNGIVDDATAIQQAIDAASAIASGLTHGAKVIIPSGDYLIKSVLTLKTWVSVIVDNGAYFLVEAGYAGAIWQGDTVSTEYSILEGGKYALNENTTFFKHIQANNGHFLFNRFSNIYVQGCKCMFDFSAAGNGWINGNTFENFIIQGAVKFMASPLAFDGNLFSNISFQTWEGKTTSVIESLNGSYNQFNNIMIYDFNVAVGGAYVIHLGASSSKNQIIGGELGYGFEDLGTNNYVFSNGLKLTA